MISTVGHSAGTRAAVVHQVAREAVAVPENTPQTDSQQTPSQHEPAERAQRTEPTAEAQADAAGDTPRTATAEEDGRRAFVVVGRVTDTEQRPLADVELSAHCGIGSLFRTGTAKTDALGRYELQFAPGMAMQISEHAPLGVGLQAATISPRLDGWYEVNLHRQGNLAMADRPPDEEAKETWGGFAGFVLPRTPYRLDFVMARAASVDGRLVNEFGRPIAGERITLAGEELPPSCSVLDSAETDDAGRFHFAAVPLGLAWRYTLRIHGTRFELITDSFTCDTARPYERTLMLRSDAGPDGAVVLRLIRQEAAAE